MTVLLLLCMRKAGESGVPGFSEHMFVYAVSGHKGDSGLANRGILTFLCPNWLFFAHSNTTISPLLLENIFCLVKCLKLLNDLTDFGRMLDILAINKKERTHTHHNVLSKGWSRSKTFLKLIKISGVIGSACFLVCRHDLCNPLKTRLRLKEILSGYLHPLYKCHSFTPFR